MQFIDLGIVSGYLLIVLLLGFVLSKKSKKGHDYFLAGRSMGWFPIGLSIMATAFSGINITAFSGEVFSQGLYVLLSLPIFAAVSPPVTRVIMPFYHRMQLCSAYEYLERRFDVRVRTLASALFILWRLFWMATALYVPCIVLNRLTGIDLRLLIVIVGSTTTLYTTFGGIKAVMWTDVLQFFVLFGTLIVCIAVSAQLSGGLWNMLKTGTAAGLMKPIFPFDPQILSLDPRIRITLWSSWIGTFTAFVTRYGVDQVVVQRYFTAKSLSHAQTGFRLNYTAAMVTLLLLALLGFSIHAYAARNGLLGRLGLQPMAYFAAFVHSMPAGISGLMITGLLAATMSSVDSGINSCAAAWRTDFCDRLFGEKLPLPWGSDRLVSVGFGILATAAATSVGRLGTLFEIANKIINGLGSPLLAIFLLAMFSRRANTCGTLLGGVAGAAWSGYVSFFVTHLALHYYGPVNLLGTLTVCYGFSRIENRLGSGPSPQQLAWTWKGVMTSPVKKQEPPGDSW